MKEAVQILEQIAADAEALKQRCFDSIRKIQANEKESFNSSSTRKGKGLGAYKNRLNKLQKQSS